LYLRKYKTKTKGMSKDNRNESKYDDEFLDISRTTKNDILYVIAIVSNPARFEKRYKLFNDFCNRMKKI